MDRFASMETFVSVVDAGSFSAAARRLGVGQPAVSKSIAHLEDKLGVRLLLRSTRGLTPTEAGHSFYKHARRAIEEADEAELAARGAGTGLSGRLRICAAVTFARLHILPKLKSFLVEHPELNIDVVLDDRNIDLLEEGIDIALRMGTLGDSGMTARGIARSQRLVLGTPAYFAAAGEPQVPADLVAHQAIIYDQRGGGGAWAFRRGTSEVSVSVSGRVQVTAAEGVRAAVLADMGVAIASEWMFAPELASGAVKPVLVDWSLPPMDLWAIYPTGRMASAKARAFVAFVEAALAASGERASEVVSSHKPRSA
ncbi:LysR family transcriptional regulator [Sulfuriferula plumbiphila]|uniref:LysR family transcriptional regulator n=1 Tax=Sulfuriferula plumbiphila TaxID=171865 RepID=A0A512L5J2_9PROT|nr:LysR family transcriptional regulator [Sulfuriferula plumbiphila]BBP03750.1 LysR family transcriptional regulator [Sulfuriferula plumbiphila]GEP29421.1 LysR family transcriptional regulator [Sulfuriferula plumbiphila]